MNGLAWKRRAIRLALRARWCNVLWLLAAALWAAAMVSAALAAV